MIHAEILGFFAVFVYTSAMFALLPQKDTLLILAKAARGFITLYNRQNAGNGFIVPVFPLFAYSDTELSGSFTSCTILAPKQADNSFYFPLELKESGSENVVVLKIVFAKAEHATLARAAVASCTTDVRFPVSARVFRIGRITFSDDGYSWQIWDDKWVKTA